MKYLLAVLLLVSSLLAQVPSYPYGEYVLLPRQPACFVWGKPQPGGYLVVATPSYAHVPAYVDRPVAALAVVGLSQAVYHVDFGQFLLVEPAVSIWMTPGNSGVELVAIVPLPPGPSWAGYSLFVQVGHFYPDGRYRSSRGVAVPLQ